MTAFSISRLGLSDTSFATSFFFITIKNNVSTTFFPVSRLKRNCKLMECNNRDEDEDEVEVEVEDEG